MKRLVNVILGGLMVISATGCEELGRTETFVFVDAEDDIREMDIRILAVVTGNGKLTEVAAVPGEDDAEYPLSFGIAPLEGDSTRRFRFEVEAREGDDLVAESAVATGFVKNETRGITIVLSTRCDECVDGFACNGGECVNEEADPEDLDTVAVPDDEPDLSNVDVEPPPPPSPTCDDGAQNGDEEGVDCGGDCEPCDPTCDDGIENGDEEGVDCGGDCDACESCDDGEMNGDEEGVDCGGSCDDACPSCDDGEMNGDEEGVDCGGSCDACPSCDDGEMNGDEEGVDCGGSCDACETCEDGIENGDEEGLDCGGSCDDACPPTCDDGLENGEERGVDCGGPACSCCEGDIVPIRPVGTWPWNGAHVNQVEIELQFEMSPVSEDTIWLDIRRIEDPLTQDYRDWDRDFEPDISKGERREPLRFEEVVPAPRSGNLSYRLSAASLEPNPAPTGELEPAIGGRYAWRVGIESETGCYAWSEPRYFNWGRQANDINGDGFADVVVGASGVTEPGTTDIAGAVFVYFGSADGLGSELDSGPQPDHIIHPPAGSGSTRFGQNIAVGDLDGDGFADLAVSAPGADVGSGCSDPSVAQCRGSIYVFRGKDSRGASWVHDGKLLSEFGDDPSSRGALQFGMRPRIMDFDQDGLGELMFGVDNIDFVRGTALAVDPDASDPHNATLLYRNADLPSGGAARAVTPTAEWNETTTPLGNPMRVHYLGGDMTGDGIPDIATAWTFENGGQTRLGGVYRRGELNPEDEVAFYNPSTRIAFNNLRAQNQDTAPNHALIERDCRVDLDGDTRADCIAGHRIYNPTGGNVGTGALIINDDVINEAPIDYPWGLHSVVSPMYDLRDPRLLLQFGWLCTVLGDTNGDGTKDVLCGERGSAFQEFSGGGVSGPEATATEPRLWRLSVTQMALDTEAVDRRPVGSGEGVPPTDPLWGPLFEELRFDIFSDPDAVASRLFGTYAIGDINGDGRDDALVTGGNIATGCATGPEPQDDERRAYVLWGADNEVGFRLVDETDPPRIDATVLPLPESLGAGGDSPRFTCAGAGMSVLPAAHSVR